MADGGVKFGERRERQFLGQVGRRMLVAHFAFAGLDHGFAVTVGVIHFVPVLVAGNAHARVELVRGFSKAVFRDGTGERSEDFLLELRQFDAVLRALRPGDARDDAGELEVHHL